MYIWITLLRIINVILLLKLCVSKQHMHDLDICNSLSSLGLYEDNVYSQNGEDGVLVAILNMIGTTNKKYVEFGVENGEQCNSRILREKFNFTGLMMDGSNNREEIHLHKEIITYDNILSLFKKYNVSQTFDVLSVDTDLYDWWILSKILGEGKYKPRIIIVEVNPTLGENNKRPTQTTMKKYVQDFNIVNSYPLVVNHPHLLPHLKYWDGTRYFGANPFAFQLLGKATGYEMLYCDRCGINCFMIARNELRRICPLNSHLFRLPTVNYKFIFIYELFYIIYILFYCNI